MSKPKLIKHPQFMTDDEKDAEITELRKLTERLKGDLARAMQVPEKEGPLYDDIYRDGFPEGYYMVHRPDLTTLEFSGVGGVSVMSGMPASTAICNAPRLMQGKKWLAQAQEIAVALAEKRKRDHDHQMSFYCDKCGYGPSELEDRPNIRPFICGYCEAENL